MAERVLAATEVQRALLDPLHRVLGWMVGHANAQGALICPQHGIEHTGKSAGAIVLALELARYASGDERERLHTIVRQQCMRLVSRLEREGDSTCFTFRPGRHDPYNCSNSVIDGGAASDALASTVLQLGDELSEEERGRFTHAAVLHAQTYLRYAIVDKGVPAQCAWAMTGAAKAFKLSGHEVLALSCDVGEERIRGKQHPDGSFPYHPMEWGSGHAGAGDASAFYQSRVSAFMAYALETVHGPELGAAKDLSFAPALDFLHGLQGPDGIKTGAVEAKPWYWGGSYEVASHPFDMAAFAVEWRRTRAPRAARALRASWRAWLGHLQSSGEIKSHDDSLGGVPGAARRSGRSYQCPFFWASHAAWIARSLPELQSALAEPAWPNAEERAMEQVRVRHFPNVDLARIDTPEIIAWIRGRRPPGNAFHGSPAGGLLRIHDRSSGRAQFLSQRFPRRPEAAWSGKVGSLSVRRGLAAGGGDLRFSTWLMRHRWRTGEGALQKCLSAREPVSALKRGVVDFSSSVVSTAFDRSTELESSDGAVTVDGPFAYLSGEGAGGRVRRVYRGTPMGIEIEETCLDPGRVRGMWFRPPVRAVVLEERGDRVRYRFGESHES